MTTEGVQRSPADRYRTGTQPLRLGGMALPHASSRPFAGRHAGEPGEAGERAVRLEHCSGPWEDFLVALDRIEADFARRCGDTVPAVRP